ncbi:MAG: hypothetical protein CVU60_16260 [Deltaproteobacteria bacterium HGW-Deltaproteobacteria-18]|jgi:hypothetical protein|nr:MAG: hypothetical protein CVU60_16260 [Deltaproteobacteria bacterium HGW-Deltaproteobacteria-18]
MDETILIDRIDAAAPIRFFYAFPTQSISSITSIFKQFILSHNENYVNFNKTKVEQCQAIAYAASLLL